MSSMREISTTVARDLVIISNSNYWIAKIHYIENIVINNPGQR